MNTATQNQKSEMKNYLYFAGTIYDSFEALEEVLGKLKLERPLFLLYAAKKAYAAIANKIQCLSLFAAAAINSVLQFCKTMPLCL